MFDYEKARNGMRQILWDLKKNGNCLKLTGIVVQGKSLPSIKETSQMLATFFVVAIG